MQYMGGANQTVYSLLFHTTEPFTPLPFLSIEFLLLVGFGETEALGRKNLSGVTSI